MARTSGPGCLGTCELESSVLCVRCPPGRRLSACARTASPRSEGGPRPRPKQTGSRCRQGFLELRAGWDVCGEPASSECPPLPAVAEAMPYWPSAAASERHGRGAVTRLGAGRTAPPDPAPPDPAPAGVCAVVTWFWPIPGWVGASSRTCGLEATAWATAGEMWVQFLGVPGAPITESHGHSLPGPLAWRPRSRRGQGWFLPLDV